MALDDEHTTDKHDESDSAQFGDDPHHLTNTPFQEATCTDCGTYVVTTKGWQGTPRCLSCHRNHAGVLHPSGTPTGHWHPAIGYPTTHTTPPTPEPKTPNIEMATWAWGCINCHELGTALNPDHATAMHKTHIGYSCPRAPGITIIEMRNRLQRRQALTQLHPQTTPAMHLVQHPNGTYTAEFGTG